MSLQYVQPNRPALCWCRLWNTFVSVHFYSSTHHLSAITAAYVDFLNSTVLPLDFTGSETDLFSLILWSDYLFSCLTKTELDIAIKLTCSHVSLERAFFFWNKKKNSFVRSSITAKMYYTVNQYACCCFDFHVFERQGNPFNLSLWWHSLGLNVGMYVLLSHISSLYCYSHFSSFYQLLIKSECRRGHFHKYANTRSHHHQHHRHLCSTSSRVESVGLTVDG